MCRKMPIQRQILKEIKISKLLKKTVKMKFLKLWTKINSWLCQTLILKSKAILIIKSLRNRKDLTIRLKKWCLKLKLQLFNNLNETKVFSKKLQKLAQRESCKRPELLSVPIWLTKITLASLLRNAQQARPVLFLHRGKSMSKFWIMMSLGMILSSTTNWKINNIVLINVRRHLAADLSCGAIQMCFM